MPERRSRPKARSAKRRSAPLPQPRASQPGGEVEYFSKADIRRLAGVPIGLIDALTRAGHLHPVNSHRTVRYSLQDLLVLRVAAALGAVNVPASKIIAAMGKIREYLPLGSSHSVSSVTPEENDVDSPQESRLLATTTAEHALPLTVYTRPPSVTAVKRRETAERRQREAEQHFESALALEDSDIAAARAAYLAALDAHSEHLEARINLGRLLHLNGELELAERIYRDARQTSALLSFNLAILLEDLNREAEALVAYREALALDPSLHDAHFNLSRLHERADRPRDALRHLLAYRRQMEDEKD